ncbi:orotate phosphoribosyltransferase [Rubricoccus marinus]|uniref:Orotate phosphoribosyltransferase n=1 Tax=Rubricoccus marinus TaxID=716817 RepID=A0A259TYG6_9BACT|nr:orotate phosphoribosyltransferase [Rubricoccus marinus]OZC02736.1 orotate phosphoribosyltransferase [Rubricoccus marinus]
MHTPSDIARDLLRIGAVSLQPSDPFTWASGRLSPIYTDNRLTLSYPDVRRRLVEGFVTLADRAGGAAGVSGTATAGIPHATLLADRLGLPLSYVRSSAKGHGKTNKIEGRIEPGERVLVVEDLVSTGGSVIDAVEALRDEGAVVQTVLAVFTYGLDAAADAISDAGFTLRTLTDFPALLDVAQASGEISADDLAALEEWRRDPEAWSRARGGA